jgi:hypothetical protein
MSKFFEVLGNYILSFDQLLSTNIEQNLARETSNAYIINQDSDNSGLNNLEMDNNYKNYIIRGIPGIDIFGGIEGEDMMEDREDNGNEENKKVALFTTRKNRLFKIEKNKKRGRKSRKKKKFHLKSDFDNVLTKIQIHFLNFLINISNDVLKATLTKNNLHFKHINYNFKKKITYEHIKHLKTVPIKELLEKDISSKYRKYSKDFNSKILQQVIPSSKWLEEFFNMKYLSLFRIYYNNCKPLRQINFNGKNINLSLNTKSFFNLLKKNRIKLMRAKIISTAQDAYFDGYKNMDAKFHVIKTEEINDDN